MKVSMSIKEIVTRLGAPQRSCRWCKLRTFKIQNSIPCYGMLYFEYYFKYIAHVCYLSYRAYSYHWPFVEFTAHHLFLNFALHEGSITFCLSYYKQTKKYYSNNTAQKLGSSIETIYEGEIYTRAALRLHVPRISRIARSRTARGNTLRDPHFPHTLSLLFPRFFCPLCS